MTANTETAAPARDERAGLLALIVVQVTLMAAPAPGWAAAAAIAVATALRHRVAAGAVWRGVRGFLVLGAIIVISHALFSGGTSGSAASALRIGPLTISLDAARAGAILAGRLLSVVAAGVVFVAALRSDGIARALGWYLNPILGSRASRVTLMTHLALRSVTLLTRDVTDYGNALRARGLQPRRRPFRYIALLGGNSVVRALMRAEHYGDAVAARGYDDHPVTWLRRPLPEAPDPTGRTGPSTPRGVLAPIGEWPWVAMSIVICLIGWAGGSLI